MFERFTQEARQVIVVAQREARELRHGHIGTEHILLGVLGEESSRACEVLASCGVTRERARERVTRIVEPGKEASPGQIPFTPRGKKVLELALREALQLGHDFIGPEHILLGLLREGEGVGARVLVDLGTSEEKIRAALLPLLPEPGARPSQTPRPDPQSGRPAHPPIDRAWFDGLDTLLVLLTAEIRRELRREPDAGDLLLALAAAQETTAGRALQELDVDIDELWGKIELIRRERWDEREELRHQIEEARRQKEEAITNQEFHRAAELRDQERQLSARSQLRGFPAADARREVRRHLGLPTPPTDPMSG